MQMILPEFPCRVPLRPCQTCGWLLAVILISGCRQAPSLEVSRQFQAAEKTFADAKTPDDYLRAASQYQEILDDGFESGIVYYNQGNAWQQAGQTGRAIAAYRQAQRSRPRDPYLAANLKQALQKRGNAPPTPSSISDHIFFWQESLSLNEKAGIATVLLALILTFAVLYQLGQHRTLMKNLSICTAIFLALLMVSMGRDWNDQYLTTHGVIVRETVGRKGGSESYEPAFTQPLADGTEFVRLRSQNEWLLIEPGDSKTCWVPRQAAVTY